LAPESTHTSYWHTLKNNKALNLTARYGAAIIQLFGAAGELNVGQQNIEFKEDKECKSKN